MKTQLSFLILLLSLPLFVYGQSVDQQTQPNDSIEGSFSNPTNLTDKQMNDAKNFTHQGIRDRTMEEGCKSINDCKDEEGFPLEMMIGKAYGMIGMFMGGSGLTLTKPDKKPETTTTTGNSSPASPTNPPTQPAGSGGTNPPAAGAKAEKETTPDYCMMAAMANEALGGMIQQSLQAQDNQQSSGDAQVQALESLIRTHETRKKTAKFQSYVYGGVTACYGFMLLTGQAAADAKFLIKMGGAGLLTTLYVMKIQKHKEAVEKVKAVLTSMTDAGKNCNPWTRSPCFCKEVTSKTLYPTEFQDVCVLNNGNFDTPKIALGCAAVNAGKMSYDKECKCKQTNSCLRSGLKAYNPKFGIGNNVMSDVNKTFDMLGSGEFDQGQLDQARLSSTAFVGRMIIKPTEKLPRPNLTPEQKRIANAMKAYMPEGLANIAAATNSSYKGGINDSGVSTAISKLPASVKEKLADAIDVEYKQGSGITSASAEEVGFEMPVMPGQEAIAPGTEIVSFAEAAVSKADVSNTPETPIFDIISNRYRRSGWQKLQQAKE